MSTEYRVVPVELLKRCIQNNDEPQPSQLYADIMAILAAPVPPAGGEVLVKILSENNGVLSVKMEVGSFTEGLELVDRTHVTRLQAEVAHLRQHKNDYMEAAEETRRAMQVELIKARGLLRDIHTGDLFGPDDWDTVDTFLSSQPAPAAKDGEA